MIRCANPGAQYQAHKAAIDGAVQRVLSSGRYLSGGEVTGFEQRFARYLGAANAVGVASGTAALELALRACGVTSGDEVITVSMTAVSTAAAIALCEAQPVLVDIDPRFYTIDPNKIEEAITPRTKAVVPVHLYGQPADMDAVLSVARQAGLRVVEDCAQAHGARWRGRQVGTLGDAGCFSFYPTKNLGALGDAGAVVTNDDALAEQVRRRREYGWNRSRESILTAGVARMDEIQAAVLAAKLTWLEQDNAARREMARRYDAALTGTPLVLPPESPDVCHVRHLYVVRTPARDQLLAHLQQASIFPGIHYPLPVHRQSAYQDTVRIGSDLAVTERLADEVLSLPLYPELTSTQVDCIVGAVRRFF